MFSFIYLLATVVMPSSEDDFIYKTTSPVSQDASVNTIVQTTSNWLIAGISIVAVIFLILGGIQYASALGDRDKIQKAKRTIFSAIIGIIIALLSYIIVPVIANLFS